MEARASRLFKVLAVVAMCAYPLAAHRALIYGGSVAAVIAYVPMLVLCYWLVRRCRSQLLAVVFSSVILLCGALFALTHHDAPTPAFAFGVPHAAINLFLLWVFGRTLAPGREPLIARFARQFHGVLTPSKERYTRVVTIIWCCFFAAQIALSVLLYAFAETGTWSFFINVLSFPLVIALFVIEYAYRLLRFRDHPHASLLTGAQMFHEDAGNSSNHEVR